MQKIIIAILFYIILSYPVHSQDSETMFPHDVPCVVINEYINAIASIDENIIRNEYFTILAFIEEAINASYENIERAFKKDIFFVKRPVIVNGRLAIVERESLTNYIWDNEIKGHKEIPDIDFVTEFVDIIIYMRIYNYLLDYWFTIMNELLGNYKDVDANIISIQELIKTYQNINK